MNDISLLKNHCGLTMFLNVSKLMVLLRGTKCKLFAKCQACHKRLD